MINYRMTGSIYVHDYVPNESSHAFMTGAVEIMASLLRPDLN